MEIKNTNNRKVLGDESAKENSGKQGGLFSFGFNCKFEPITVRVV